VAEKAMAASAAAKEISGDDSVVIGSESSVIKISAAACETAAKKT